MGEPLLLKSCRCTNLLLALAVAPALLAADWFPLETGNQWVYKGTGGVKLSPRVVCVGEAREFGGHSYYAVTGLLSGGAWLRTEGGRVLAWDEAAGGEALWYDFSTAAGGSYQTALPRTSGTVTLTSRDAVMTVPAGTFPGAVTLDYTGVRTGDFAPAMVQRESFAAGVGLLTQDLSMEAPQGRYELAYARIGGVTVIREAENGIELSINEAKTHARFHVGQEPGLVKTLRLYDETGSEIWTASSAGRISIALGDLNVDLPSMKAGRYIITGDSGDQRVSLPFTVQ